MRRCENGQGRPTLLWRRVFEALQTEAGNGVIRPGERLPNEANLAKRFEVNRHTIRRAMAELQSLGLINIVQGSGTFISMPLITWHLQKISEFAPYVAKLGMTSSTSLISSKTGTASAPIARSLGIAPGASTLQVLFLRKIEGIPWSIERREFSSRRFERFPELLRSVGSMTKTLEQSGNKDIVRGNFRIGARRPDKEEKGLLDLNGFAPVAAVEFVDSSNTAEPLSWSSVVISSDRVRIISD